MAEYNVQQKQFIQEYKAQHKLTNQTDEQIMLFIQKDMQTNGVVYPGFEHLANPNTSASSTANGQIFDTSNKSDENKGISVEKSSTTETSDNLPSEGKEVTTDENGNTITTIKDGDDIIEQTISSTDEKGNNIETVVNYQDGKPIKQTKKKNGNIDTVTAYKYHDASEENKLAYVTLETTKADNTKVITTALETDKYGNVDQEDFLDRTTISKDGTVTSIYIQDGNLLEQKVKFDGKKVTTMYNGKDLKNYDANKLHRLVQETEEKGIKRYALYDGKGNTKTTVQNGESPALIAQKFKVKENTLRRLNPKKGKDAITQVGADILIPGEFNADSYPMRVRKSKAESINKYNKFESKRLINEINSGEVQNIKLAKSYNNVYEFAKDRLLKSGVKNPDNNQINEEANKLILLNGEKFSYKAGKTVKIAKSLTESKPAQELTKYGFKASAGNRIFFQKFNNLNSQQKQNVLSAIQYCKSQKITNLSDIKAKVLETLGINLFDSNKTVPMVADNNYGVMAYQRNSKPISIETFVKDHLKLDIKSDLGKTVLDRLSQVDQAQLNKISAKDFKGFNNKTLDSVASMLETVGVQIRTQAEINVKNNTPRAKAEKEKRAVRIAAAENIALAYDNAINVIKNYQGNQGWMNVGFYREKLGQLLDKVNPTDVATCFDAVVKRLEKEKQYAVSRLKTASANESEFRQAFKDLTGKDYNENSVKNFIAQAQKGGDWTKAYDKAFGDRVVKRATDKVNFQQYVDGAGDIVLMLLGTEAIGKGVAWAGSKVATKLAPYVPKVLSKIGGATVMNVGGNSVTVSRVAGSMVTSAATFTTWDASKNYINLKTKDIQYSGEDAVKEWQAYKEGNVESAKFGAFAGLLNSTVVGKVVNGTMKLFEKPVAKAVQGVAKTLEKGEAVTGTEVMKTFIAKQAPGMVAKTAGTVAEVAGFTMYETANEITKELLKTDANGQRHLPKDLTEEGLTNYLWTHLKGQAANLGEIKAISKLIFMHKGAIAERERMMNENLSKCEMLSNVKVQKAEVNGREVYEVTMPNGNRKVAHTPEEIVAYCNNLMLMDMAMNSKTTETEANPNAPKGMNVEEDALLEKATKENPAEVVTEKVKKQWQQADLKKEATEEKVDLFNPDTKAGLNEPAPEVKDEVTSLIFTGKLKDSLTQHYNELGNVFKDIAKNRSADFKKLAKECGSDKEAFCEGVISILSEEIGMKGFEPKIEMKNLTGEADGQADWTKGTIYINSTENNVKKLVGLISHEYVHMLQYRDILAQYGEKGLREVIMNDNNIPQEKKESQLSEILKSSYTKKLLDNYDNLKHSPENSLNEYITRIYKDEFSNGIDPNKDMKGYTNQGVEREAYHLGSGKLGNNTTQLEGLTLEKEESMKDVLARMRAKLKTGQTSQDIKDNTSPKKAENFVVNEDGSITRIGNIPKGIVQSEITSENFEQQKADFIKEFNEKVGKFHNILYGNKVEKISTPEDLAAVKEFWEWTNSEEGKKQFRDSYEIIDKINANNIADFKELVETINAQKELSDDIKHSLLYDAIAGGSIKETKEFIQGIEPSDLAKLNELEGFDRIMLSGSSAEQKAKLDFYKEIKTGKYDSIIKDDNIFKHVLSIGYSVEKTKSLYDAFAGENISKEWFAKIQEGLEDSDVNAIKQLYSKTKDLLDNNSDMSWIMFRNLKQEDIPAKIEIINTLKSAKATNEEICEILNKTNKNNLDVAKDLVQKAFANGDEKAEKYNIVIILNKLTRGVYSKEFVEKNAEALLHLDGTCIRKTTETNLELASKISENKEISSYQVDMMLNYATDKERTQKLIDNLDNGYTKLPEFEVISQNRADLIEIIKKHLPPEKLQEIENFSEDKEEFEQILIGQASSRTLRDVKLSQAEENVVDNIIRITKPFNYGTDTLHQARSGLEKYFGDRDRTISDMNYALENAQYKDEATKQQTLAKFNDLYPLLSNDELKDMREIYLKTPEKERLNIDYSLIAKREIIPLLQKTPNYGYSATEKALEFLNCSDAEFKQKKHNLETRTQELRNEYKFSEWKRILNMPEAEFNKLKTPFELRTETPVDIKAYEAQMREKMADRITYDPVEAAELIERAEKNQSLRNEMFGNDYVPDKINAFEKLPKKAPVAVTPLPAAGNLMRELRNTGHVKLSIPNEGGVKVKPYDAVIHPEDDYRLNVTQDAGIKIRYGTKLQWSNFKIARDLLQNYYDGHGHTLEGVNIEVNKTAEGKYKIKISGESSWDYSHLDQMGSSTKHDPLDAGGYGEGTRAVAVSLLSKADITNVKYASGDWAMTYGRSSDDLKSAYMTQTLSKNSEKVKGSTVEFETENADIAHKLLEAKDYFNHPHNPDFKNLDFENEFFGFKLKDDGAKGNIYLIQRYETDGESNNGLRGATIVFKTQPNHPTLVEKSGGEQFELGTGVDRAQIPSYDVNRILSRYVKTMTDEELTQTISSMEKFWGESGTEKDRLNDMYVPFVREAHRRGLGIDFKDAHYVYLDKPSTSSYDMAKNLGYKIANKSMKDVGMQSFYAKDASKLPHQPTEEQSKEIRLLEEGVRILQECTDLSTKDLLNSDEVNKPTYMFSEGDHGTGAEAIIEGGEYQGHWMRDSHLLLQNYVGNLATFLHEISHKSGGDETKVFSMQLTKLQSHITNAIMHNPNAFKKLQTLSKMFDEVRSQEFNKQIPTTEVIQDKSFTPEQYKQHIDNLLSVTPEYREYVEPEPPKEPEPIEYTGDENRIVSTGNSGELGKIKIKSFEENRKLTSRFNIAGIKRFAKSFIHKILRHKPSKVEEDGGIILGDDDFASFTIDAGVAHFDKPIAKAQKPAKEEKHYKYEAFTPSKHESYTTLKSSDSMMKELEEKGSVALSIPNAGGLKPKISDTPSVEKDNDFNKTVSAQMTLSYAQKRNWSNEKIARDLMQNFYDGNGHTLEGVDLKVKQNDNGTYTIRIDGKGIYNYEHLKRLGGSDKDNPKDAGGFGEGSRIIAGSLLAKGTNRVRFACKDWQMDFTTAENVRTHEEGVMRTLTKNEAQLDGNYVEFDTNDKELVEKIMDSKNYFYSPNNPDFRDLDIENEFFGFKVTPDKNGNLYYIQRFQTPDKKMDNGLQNMTLIFKQAAFGENFQNKGGYTIDLNTTRDRMAIEAEQMSELTRAYAKTLPDADLVKAISALEPIFTSDNCNSEKFRRENKANNLSYQFAQSIIHEAASRGIKLDFEDKKIVYVQESSEWRTNLSSKEEAFFKKEGYIFANMGTELGIEDAESLYAKLHRPHSIKPTEQQAKQLQILNEAVNLITSNDKMGLFPNEGTQLYAFDETSNIESSTGYYAAVNSKNLDGVFIHTNKLKAESFPTMLTNVLCEMLEGQTSKNLSSYSYNQTELIRSQLNTLITQPQIIEKLNILEKIYKEQQK
mgnify:CR=1 FL=1